MREIMQQVAFVDEATSAAAMTPLMQHRIRGALNAAGFESTGRKFSAGDYKGQSKTKTANHIIRLGYSFINS